MSQKLARELLSSNVIPNWTIAEFEVLDRRILSRIATANGKSTEGLPVEIQAKIQQKGLNDADKGLAVQVLHSGRAKNVCATRPETFMNTHGGTNFFKSTEVSYQGLNGKTVRRANAAIPIHFEEVEARENVQAVAAFCAQLVRNDAGVWKPNINPIAWSKVFTESSVKIPGMMKVAGMAAQILNKDEAWKGMAQLSKNAITGIENLSFVRAVMDRVTTVSYDLLNTTIVCDALRVYDKDAQGYFKAKQENGKPWVPAHAYREVECSEETAEILAEGGFPACYWYFGNFACEVAFPPTEGTIKSALLASARMREVQGSDNSPCAILAGMRGYSGMNDEFGKRCQFMVSSTLAVWQRDKVAAVWLESVGDIPILVSSLLRWKKEIKGGRHEQFGSSSLSAGDGSSSSILEFKPYSCDFKLIIPRQLDLVKVHSAYRDHVASMTPPNSVVILWASAGLPTSDVKGAPVQYDSESQRILPEQVTKMDYIAYCAIYGSVPFPSDVRVKQSNSKKFEAIQWWSKAPIVYKWSNASGFRGVLSTFADLELWGWGYPMVGSAHDETKVQFLPIKMEKVSRQADWYDFVSADALTQTLTFMNVVSRYSPISNLCSLGAKGVTIARMAVTTDGGLVVPNLQEVASRVGQVKRERVEPKWQIKPPTPKSSPVPLESSSSRSAPSGEMTTKTTASLEALSLLSVPAIPVPQYEAPSVENYDEMGDETVEDKRITVNLDEY
jgi:hypothetical protein